VVVGREGLAGTGIGSGSRAKSLAGTGIVSGSRAILSGGYRDCEW
jgi:hypothetical protein